MGQPIYDFHRRDPQSSLYINSGFSAGMRKMRSLVPRVFKWANHSESAFQLLVPPAPKEKD
jgi:hypothetical protein